LKKQIKQLKEILQQFKEDFEYLLFAGVPTAVGYWILNNFIRFGEVY
jgi:hypothetical protein